jgi:hypothetical protein
MHIFITAATSVYFFKVIFAELSPVAIFPVLPRATKGLAVSSFSASDNVLVTHNQAGALEIQVDSCTPIADSR